MPYRLLKTIMAIIKTKVIYSIISSHFDSPRLPHCKP